MMYVSTPYSHSDESIRELRYNEALRFLQYLAIISEPAVSIIVQYHPLMQYLPMTFEFWSKIYTPILQASSSVGVLMIEGWDTSKGVTDEINKANAFGKELKYFIKDGKGLYKKVITDKDYGILSSTKEQQH